MRNYFRHILVFEAVILLKFLTGCGYSTPVATLVPNSVSSLTSSCGSALNVSVAMVPATATVPAGVPVTFQVTVTGGSGSYLYGQKGAAPSIRFQSPGYITDTFTSTNSSQVEAITVADSLCPSSTSVGTSAPFSVGPLQPAAPSSVSCVATPSSSVVSVVVSPSGQLYSQSIPMMSFNVQSTNPSVPIMVMNYDEITPIGSLSNQPVQSGILGSIPLEAAGNIAFNFHVASVSAPTVTGVCSTNVFVQSVTAGCQVVASSNSVAVGTPVTFTLQTFGPPALFAVLNGGLFLSTSVYAGPTTVKPTAAGTYSIGALVQFAGAPPVPCTPASVVVSVPAPTVTLTANGAANASISYNSQATLQWTSQNIASCKLTSSTGLSQSEPASGSLATVSLTANANYTMTCTNATGSATSTVNIAVGPKPSTLFSNPMLSGGPVDGCTNNYVGGAGACGQLPAIQFCQLQGYSTATQWTTAWGSEGTQRFDNPSGGSYSYCGNCSFHLTAAWCQ